MSYARVSEQFGRIVPGSAPGITLYTHSAIGAKLRDDEFRKNLLSISAARSKGAPDHIVDRMLLRTNRIPFARDRVQRLAGSQLDPLMVAAVDAKELLRESRLLTLTRSLLDYFGCHPVPAYNSLLDILPNNASLHDHSMQLIGLAGRLSTLYTSGQAGGQAGNAIVAEFGYDEPSLCGIAEAEITPEWATDRSSRDRDSDRELLLSASATLFSARAASRIMYELTLPN